MAARVRVIFQGGQVEAQVRAGRFGDDLCTGVNIMWSGAGSGSQLGIGYVGNIFCCGAE